MQRTTIFADPDLMRELKQLARQQQRPVAAVIREALGQYLASKRQRGRRFSFTEMGESATGDLSGRVDAVVREHLQQEFERERQSWTEELRKRGEA